MPKQSISRVL